MDEEKESASILVLPEDSNAVWERLLPPDYFQVIGRAVSPVVFGSKKQLYLCLSDSHILLDRGYLSFKLDKWSGKKCFMLGARELSITWQDDTSYWEWQSIPESRFPEVCILRKVCWLEIRGKIAAVMLSQNTTYAAYLVFRIARDSRGLAVPAKTIVSFGGIETETTNVFLQKPGARSRLWHVPLQNNDGFPRKRRDGWMEIELGEFYCDERRDGEVEMAFEEIRHGNWKNDLVVEGIELRPKLVTTQE
ncbi:hypothetical protein L6452_09317 [Arctium lappa]|uniref:Uncharacterized protein n=1 Tax=Arctium lappa TaxID=4217 RepID=A0ACB9DKB9_ARCLA|nr:hypothetical protein L6452_09317 [Arctium lappa]